MSNKRYTIDDLGSKTSIRVLRILFRSPFRYQSISEISRRMNTSRANVHRGLRSLDRIGIIRRPLEKGRSLVRINTSSPIALPLFSLFNNEDLMQVKPSIRNTISLLLSERDDISTLILFGSHARGTASKDSDIDLLAVCEDEAPIKKIKKIAREFLPDQRIEIHSCDEKELLIPRDLAILDAVLFGISLTGDDALFRARSDLEYIDSSYLISRLRSCKDNLLRSIQLKDESSEYFKRVAMVTLGEIGSIMFKGETVSKSEIGNYGDLKEEIERMDEELSRRGDRIWLK